MFVKNSTGVLKKVLLCRPTYLRLTPINEIAKRWGDAKLDAAKMEAEHSALVSAYHANGVETVFLDAEADLPYMVFARDFGGCIHEGYVLGNFREPVRVAEKERYRAKMQSLGVPLVTEVTDGFFEGGDFWFLDDTTLAIGMIARSDARGVESLRRALSPLGYTVLGVPAREKYLHLDMCFNLVREDLAVGYPPCLPEEFIAETKRRGIEIIAGTEEAVFQHGYNIQALGEGRVLSLARNAALNEELDKRGLKVTALDITEILKAGGGPHCMTFPLERV